MNLRRLSVFVRVVEDGSFAAAARSLCVPRSAVSQAVGALEEELGVRLLHRSTRAMTLTDAGAQLHAKTAPALRTITDAAAAVTDREGPLRGLVRITTAVEVGTRLLEPILSRFLIAEPGVRIELQLTTKVLDLAESGIDLAVRSGPVRDASLVARRLGPPYSAALFASPTYLSRRAAPRRAHELAQHDTIVVHGHARACWRLRGPKGVTHVDLTPRLEVDAWGFALRAACSGVGIAVLPTFLCEDERKTGALVQVLPAYSIEEKSMWLVYSSARHLSRPVVAVRDAIRAAFAR